jgi:uncharacterized protein DUF6064
MSEWWTYSLSDFLLFSPRTYYRLFELYNAAIWPAQIAAIGLGLAIWALVTRAAAARGRIISGILAGCWLWVAIAFHANRYAAINWAAVYFAWGFGLEAALLLWKGVVRGALIFDRPTDSASRAGLGIFLFALALEPAVSLLCSRPFRQLEVFGVAPDPTAVATLGLLVLAKSRPKWLLFLVPAIWCFLSGATLLAMKAPDAWVAPLAAALALALAARRALARGGPASNGVSSVSIHRLSRRVRRKSA